MRPVYARVASSCLPVCKAELINNKIIISKLVVMSICSTWYQNIEKLEKNSYFKRAS